MDGYTTKKEGKGEVYVSREGISEINNRLSQKSKAAKSAEMCEG